MSSALLEALPTTSGYGDSEHGERTLVVVVSHRQTPVVTGVGIDDLFVDTNLFTITWLEARAVFTFSDVNGSIEAFATMRDIYLDIGAVLAALWEFNVDVGLGC